ncbi:MAG: beta-lactamase hydrolase domain-containing protein [Thiohalorhabdus sp.]|uniref:beta-lactamase hydrolase domain-containing protein n=1 Tax=Thiohalorhabdus sp. TaxID=3094134 RepID=UPI00397F7D60
MMQIIQMDEDYVVGLSVPDPEEMEELAAKGFRAVANLREAGEEKEYLSPREEEEQARRNDMEYVHTPVSTDDLSEERVDELREVLQQLPRPVLVHCKSGKRSGAFLLMHTASERGQSGEEAVGQAESMGFRCENAEMEQFVTDYINRHNH